MFGSDFRIDKSGFELTKIAYDNILVEIYSVYGQQKVTIYSVSKCFFMKYIDFYSKLWRSSNKQAVCKSTYEHKCFQD